MREEIAYRALSEIVQRVALQSVTEMVERALEFALQRNTSIFDSFYVLLAIREGCQLVTADERLYNGLRLAWSDRLVWIEDFPGASV